MNELNKNKEELNINNIGILYFTVKEAEQLAGVSSQTLYSYNNKGIIKMHKLAGRNQNYIYLEDIELVKKMVQENKNIMRASGAVQLNNKEIAINKTEGDSEEIKELTSKLVELEKEIVRLTTLESENNKTITNLNKEIEELKKSLKEKDDELKQEQEDRINDLNTITDLKTELAKLKEVDKLADTLQKTVNTLNNEKEDMYKEQINTLIAHNTELSTNNNELMNKFDRFIDSQQAFQVMIAQKEESTKLIEEKSASLISKIFKKK